MFYELDPNDARPDGSVVTAPAVPIVVARDVTEGLDGQDWARSEFAGADLGDRRMNEPLAEFAHTLGEMPGRAFCGAAQGDKAASRRTTV